MTDDDILNAIRNGRLAAAKRELTSKILKYPQKNLYRALNACYLFKTGSTKDALEECNKLKAKVPGDQATLEIIFETYRNLGKKSEASAIYENAAKKYPSPELILSWFNKSVDLFDAQMIQSSANALKEHFPSNREYRLRSAFADFLSSSEINTDEERLRFLDMASKTLQDIGCLQTNQEIFLHASILSKMNDLDEVIKLLEPVESKELEMIIMLLDAFDRSQKWEHLYQYAHELIFEKSFNDYDTWKYLIKAGFNLGKGQDEICALVKFDSRNSYVANIEIARIYGNNLEQAIEKYYENYKSKPCCPTDLAAFNLTETFKSKLLATRTVLLEKSALSKVDVAVCVNIEKLLSSFGSHHIDWQTYEKYDNAELGDLFLASVVQSLGKDLSVAKIIQSIIELERRAELDPENFSVKLWLLNLYSNISGSSLALESYKDLKIKMIQHDTVSYKLNLEPSIKNLNQLVEIYRFYLTGTEEITTFFQAAFEKGLYTKLEDLYRFGKRLKQSVSKYLLVLQLLKMCRMLNSDYYTYFVGALEESKADVIGDSFVVSDNRDFDTDYDFGFDFGGKILFNSEGKKSKEHVQLFWLKELLIATKHNGEAVKLLKLLQKWLEDPKFTNNLSPSETQFFKLYLSIFKHTFAASTKEKESHLNFLKKNLDFAKTTRVFLSQTSPLSSSANKALVDSLELVKVINTCSNDDTLKSLGRKFQQGIVQYVVTNPEIKQFKEIRESLDLTHLPEAFTEAQLDRLEDGIRASKFKMR